MSDELKTWPERVWLQSGEMEVEPYPGCAEDEIKWCDSKVDYGDVEYIRADLAPAAPAVQKPMNCREAGPGKGLCIECANGRYERCRYVMRATQEPVAFTLFINFDSKLRPTDPVFFSRRHAEEQQAKYGGEIVPLYAAPVPAVPPELHEARELIFKLAEHIVVYSTSDTACTLADKASLLASKLEQAQPFTAPPSPGPQDDQVTTPMCERKTNDIMQRDGYHKTGYVLMKDDPSAHICVSDQGAVSWFTPEQWHWLMHNRDHVEFEWSKPIGAHPSVPQDAKDAQRYRYLKDNALIDWKPEDGLALVIPEPATGRNWKADTDAAIDAAIAAQDARKGGA